MRSLTLLLTTILIAFMASTASYAVEPVNGHDVFIVASPYEPEGHYDAYWIDNTLQTYYSVETWDGMSWRAPRYNTGSVSAAYDLTPGIYRVLSVNMYDSFDAAEGSPFVVW
jgi:hypothetical protein